MTPTELRALGRKLKKQNPGKWDEFSDLKVGKVAVKHGAVYEPVVYVEAPEPEPEPEPEEKPLPQPGFLFPSWQAKYKRNQADHIVAKRELETNQVTYHSTIEGVVRDGERKGVEAEATHDDMLAQTFNRLNVANKATEQHVDSQTYLRLKTRQHEIEQDISRARELEDVRLHGYKQEVEIDLQGLLFERLMPHATVLGVVAHLQKLFMERANLAALNIPDDTKQKMLAVHDNTIKAFEEDLNVQISRHLLQKGDGEKVQAINEASDSPSGD